MLLLGDTGSSDLPNLSAVMKEYGMEEADGYIADPQRCYQGNAFYIFPMLSVSGNMAKGLASEMVLLINAHGLNLTDPARDTISTTSFMTTSNSGTAVTEDSQTEGTYTLGAVATETVSGSGNSDHAEEEASENDSNSDAENSDTKDSDAESGGSKTEEAKEARLTVISSANMIDSQITETFTTLENTTLFMNAVTANFDGVENLSIQPKSLAVQYNTVQHVGLLSLLAIFGIPLVILVGGFTVWFRRRKA